MVDEGLWNPTPLTVHARIASLHVPLTTQLYFKDDPYIAKDPWASRSNSDKMASSCAANLMLYSLGASNQTN